MIRQLKSWEKEILRKFETQTYIRTDEEENLIEELKEFNYLTVGIDFDINIRYAILTDKGLYALRN